MKEIVEIRTTSRLVKMLIPRREWCDVNRDERTLPDGKKDPLYFSLWQLKIDAKELRTGWIRTVLRLLSNDVQWAGTERIYTQTELTEARAFYLNIINVFEPCGEMCGTCYDTKDQCRFCGIGRRLVGNLKLDRMSFPKGGGIAKSISNEWIMSKDIADLIMKEKLTGIEFNPIQCCITEGMISDWVSFTINRKVQIDAGKTIFGAKPFVREKDINSVCPQGHTLGLNLLSEIVLIEYREETDFCVTEEYVGVNRGYLYPEPLIIISPRVYRVFADNRIEGVVMERVRINVKMEEVSM